MSCPSLLAQLPLVPFGLDLTPLHIRSAFFIIDITSAGKVTSLTQHLFVEHLLSALVRKEDRQGPRLDRA